MRVPLGLALDSSAVMMVQLVMRTEWQQGRACSKAVQYTMQASWASSSSFLMVALALLGASLRSNQGWKREPYIHPALPAETLLKGRH